MYRRSLELYLRNTDEHRLAEKLLSGTLEMSSRERQLVALLTPYTVDELRIGLRACEWDGNTPITVENVPDGEYEMTEAIGQRPDSPTPDG